MKYLLITFLFLSSLSYSQQARYFDIWRTQGPNDYVTIDKDELRIGDGTTSNDKFYIFDNGTANLPFIGYDEGDSKLIGSHDGVTTFEIGEGGGEGGGQGGINFIDNYNFESNLDGWSKYNDGSVATPVDGTGGSSAEVLDRLTTTPIREVYYAQLFKNTGDFQGTGISYDFNTDGVDKGDVLKVHFWYRTINSYTSGDLQIFIYDVTNSNLINVISGKDILNSSDREHVAFFKTASDSTSYRLIFHTTTSTSPSWGFEFDNISISPIIVSGKVNHFAEYNTNTSQSIPTGTDTVINFEDKVDDVLDLVTVGGSWQFEAKIPGIYSYSATVKMTNATVEAGTSIFLKVRKNGSARYETLSNPNMNSGSVSIRGLIRLEVGETLDFVVFHNDSDAITLNTNNMENFVNISLVND